MLRRINSNRNQPQLTVVGNVRQNQIITSFGIGSMVDFVDQTVMIMGTYTWDWASENPDNPYRINNKNLEGYLSAIFGRRINYFIHPKTEAQTPFWSDKKSTDIQATVFPRMLYCVKCKKLSDKTEKYISKGKYLCKHIDKENGNIVETQLVPSRFLAVCPKGHIEDFPYSWWIHEGNGKKKCDKPKIKMYYVDNKTDMDHLYVECMNCHEKRPMKGASAANALSHYKCTGNRPWLGDHDPEDCTETMKMCIRNESNVYFPCCVSALTIPPWSTKLVKEIEKYLGIIDYSDEQKKQILVKILKKPGMQKIPLDAALSVFERVENKSNETNTMQAVMEDEYCALSDEVSGDSELYLSHIEIVPNEYKNLIDSIIAIDKLTVVSAMVGFSRLEAQELGNPNMAPLSPFNQDWFPAVEQKGEGIFIKLNNKEIEVWTKRIGNRYDDMARRLDESFYSNERFSPRYVLLHTFAHLFIREISNKCGYSTASMKERIYSTYYENGQEKGIDMAGILIYTSSSDADGSLGGLIEQARTENMSRLLNSMIERAKWCSSDPVCVSSKEQGYLALNYAACYACSLLPETSCEFRNILLDRVAIIGTLENPNLGYFNRR